MKIFYTMVLAVIFALPLHSQQSRKCKGSPEVVARCFRVHGRVRIVNGAGMVIWHIGTDRKLEVEDEENIPLNLSKAISKPGDAYGRDVFGDFELCPLTKSKPGEMQMVCVESATRLVVNEKTH